MRKLVRIVVLITGAVLLTPIGILIFNPSHGTINNVLYWTFTLTIAGLWGWNFDKIFPAEKKTDE